MDNPTVDEKTLEAAVRSEAAERRRGAAHPGPDELLSYIDGGLPEARRDALQQHLAACGECARTVLDLASFDAAAEDGPAPPGTGEARLSEFETAAAWRRLERQLREAPRGRPSALPVYALAASLLLAVAGLGGWVAQLRGRVAELSEPRLNVLIGDLLPADTTRKRSGGEDRIVIPPATEHLLLLLNLADLRSFASYRVTITAAGGGEVFSSRSPRRGPEGNFTLEVDRRLLPAGTYRITLHGVEATDEELLAEYALALEYPVSDPARAP